jgi:hypothetical protein
MSINVEGVLNQYKRKKINFCSHEDGTEMSDAEARFIFLKARNEGKRVLPMSEDCYRFCFEKGCKGHIKALMPSEEVMDKIELDYLLFKQGKRV